MTIYTYTTREERARLIATAEGAGEQMYHDEIRDGVNSLVFGPPEADIASVVSPHQRHQQRLQELLAIDRADWTADNRDEMLELTARCVI